MTEQETKDMLKAKLKCLELDSDIEGCDGNCNECEYCYTQGTVGEQKEALKIAIKSLERQIPKKPREYEDKYYGCPVCGNVLMGKWSKYPNELMPKSMRLPYCLGCGQAIDWSDEE